MTTTLRHPHIIPHLEIEVTDERVDDHLRAGWLLVEPEPVFIPSPDPDLPGEDHEQEQA